MAKETLPTQSAEPTLNAVDAHALDAMLEHGGPRSSDGKPLLNLTTQATPPVAPDARLKGWLDVLAKSPVSAVPADLTARTLARVVRAKAERLAMIIEEEGVSFGGGLRWPEMAAAIAIVLTGVLLALPALDHVRTDARRVACADNLDASGQALAQYAADNKGALPRYATSPGSVWWNVGKVVKAPPKESNTANLYNLIRSGYASASRLNCPENKDAPRNADPDAYDWPAASAVSYSYQNQFAPHVPTLERNARNAILADKNPLFAGVTNRSTSYLPAIPNDSPSYFHDNRGQNILMSHGAVSWQRTPLLQGGDNIWVTNGSHDAYTGTETNTDPNDSFLVP
jgi:hypothetical protein